MGKKDDAKKAAKEGLLKKLAKKGGKKAVDVAKREGTTTQRMSGGKVVRQRGKWGKREEVADYSKRKPRTPNRNGV